MTEESNDPNADLIGKVLTIADREWTIAGTVSWSDSYIILSRPGPEPGLIDGMIRPAAVIRNHLRIVGA